MHWERIINPNVLHDAGSRRWCHWTRGPCLARNRDGQPWSGSCSSVTHWTARGMEMELQQCTIKDDRAAACSGASWASRWSASSCPSGRGPASAGTPSATLPSPASAPASSAGSATRSDRRNAESHSRSRASHADDAVYIHARYAGRGVRPVLAPRHELLLRLLPPRLRRRGGRRATPERRRGGHPHEDQLPQLRRRAGSTGWAPQEDSWPWVGRPIELWSIDWTNLRQASNRKLPLMVELIFSSLFLMCTRIYMQPRGVVRGPQLPDRQGRRRGSTAAGAGQEMEHAAGERRAAAGALQWPSVRRVARGPRRLRPDLQVSPQLGPVLLVRWRWRRHRPAGQAAAPPPPPRAGMVWLTDLTPSPTHTN